MIIAGVEVFSEHMRACLLSGNGAATVESLRARLVANLRYLREAYDSLLKLDLPSQVGGSFVKGFWYLPSCMC